MFPKAFELDATEAEAARRLAIGYADNDEWALVRAIAVRVMEARRCGRCGRGRSDERQGRFAPKNGWAWKALGSTEMVSGLCRAGLMHQFYRNYGKAAQALQIALRADRMTSPLGFYWASRTLNAAVIWPLSKHSTSASSSIRTSGWRSITLPTSMSNWGNTGRRLRRTRRCRASRKERPE